MPQPKKPIRYRLGCQCGACPRIPGGRPPTLAECRAYYGHDRWFSAAKVEQLAVGHYVWAYVAWVNTRGWRKPPGWTSGKVPLAKLRPARRPITAVEMNRAIHAKLKGVTVE